MQLEDTPLISRRALFGNPDRTSVQISPNGTHLAWLAPRAGVLNLWVAPRESSSARPVTHDIGRGIHAYYWAYTAHTSCMYRIRTVMRIGGCMRSS